VRRRPLALATGNEATNRPAFGGTALTTYGSAGGIGSRTGGGKRVGGDGKRTFPWHPPKGGPGYARRNIPTNPLAAQSSFTKVGTGFQRVLHPPGPYPQRELWELDRPALSPWGKLQTLI
jgi:hypothetical protein